MVFGGAIKNVINSILSGIESMANGIVQGVNKIIDTLNNLNVHIPDWVPLFGGKDIGFNINHMGEVSLPRLATGNVAYDETLAIFGEYAGASNNPEITAPQSVLADTFRNVLSEFNGNNSSNGLEKLEIRFGSSKVAYEIADLLNQAKRANGKAIIEM